jgi:hypothetical protein
MVHITALREVVVTLLALEARRFDDPSFLYRKISDTTEDALRATGATGAQFRAFEAVHAQVDEILHEARRKIPPHFNLPRTGRDPT